MHEVRAEDRLSQTRTWVRRSVLSLTLLWVVQPALSAQRRSYEATSTSGIFSLPRSQDDTAELELARREIGAGKFDQAVERLDTLLRRGFPGVVPVLQGVNLYRGLRFAVIETLRDMPEQGRVAYERLTRREGGHLMKRPIHELRPDQLLTIAVRFPTSETGFAARLRLGDLALEAGDAIAAQSHLLAAHDTLRGVDSPQIQSLAKRRRVAAFLERDLRGQAPAERNALADELGPIATGTRSRTWPEYGGGYDGTTPMVDPVGDSVLLHGLQITAEGFDSQNNMFPMHATGDLNGIYINNGIQVFAIDPLETKRASPVQWIADGPMIDDPGTFGAVMRSINGDMVLSPAVADDIVIAALHVPNIVMGAGHNQRYQSIDVIRKIASRRLFAFDRTTGKRIWAHWDSPNGKTTERFRGHDAAAPPLIQGDKVYVASHDLTGAISFYLTAYDLHTGATAWRRLICSSQQEVNMFGNARQEFAAAPLAVFDGVIYGTTNLGVCFAANAADGEIRWIKGYEVIPLPMTRLRGQDDRQVFFANNPICVKDKVMVCTPLDSEYALGLDTRDGSLVWRMNYDGPGHSNVRIRWLLGIQNDEVLFSGTGVVAVKLRPQRRASQLARVRVVRSPAALNEEDNYNVKNIPRGALTEKGIYFIGNSGSLLTFNRRGDAIGSLPDVPITHGGNLLLTDGILVTVRDRFVDIYGDLDKLILLARRDVKAQSDDPEAILRLVSLLRASPHSGGYSNERLENLLSRGLTTARAQGLGAGSVIYRKLASSLFDHKLERAKQTAKVSKQRGLQQLAAARKRAITADDWLEAQLEILDLCTDDSALYLTELARLAEHSGHLHLTFPKLGSLPVAAYVLWKSIPRLPPADAVLRCQELKDRFGDILVAQINAGQFADRTLEALVAVHGKSIYQKLEDAATALLQLAGEDAAALRAVARRYPHSDAAEQATARLLDAAVAAGDLKAAARSFGESIIRGQPPAGVLRRMLAASAKRGNGALALALAQRLRKDHAATASDYGPDGGKTYAQVTAHLQPQPLPALPPAQLPVDIIGELQPRSEAVTLKYVPCELISGFEIPAQIPIYTNYDDHQLRAYRADPPPKDFGAPLFELKISARSTLDLMLCGNTLLLCEQRAIRAVAFETGEKLWELKPSPGRDFECLGVTSGVLHLFSALYQTRGDGGELFGIEPVTGAVLYHKVFASDRYSIPPIVSAKSLFTIEVKGKVPTIVEHDALTGHESYRIPLTEATLAFLGLANAASHRITEPSLNRHLFATARAIYLGTNDRSNDARPKLIALDRSGERLWTWVGHPGCNLIMEAPYRDTIVILEMARNRNSHITTLDSNGHELFSRVLGQGARCLNWQDRVHRQSAPRYLFISSKRDSDTPSTLLCFALEPSERSFELELPGARAINKRPILSDTFLAILTREAQFAVRLHVINRKTRRGALPNGNSKKALAVTTPVQLWQHGPYIIVSDSDTLKILGSKKK